jgi:hypothetical protein
MALEKGTKPKRGHMHSEGTRKHLSGIIKLLVSVMNGANSDDRKFP